MVCHDLATVSSSCYGPDELESDPSHSVVGTVSPQIVLLRCRFHEIEPQLGVMELLKPAQLSRKVLAPPRGTVPYPLLNENTLVLSDQMTLLRRRGGRLELSARVGDVYPNQVRCCAALSGQCCLFHARPRPASLTAPLPPGRQQVHCAGNHDACSTTPFWRQGLFERQR
jgi:hypothetical protein